MSLAMIFCSSVSFLLCHKIVVSSANSVKIPVFLCFVMSFTYSKNRSKNWPLRYTTMYVFVIWECSSLYYLGATWEIWIKPLVGSSSYSIAAKLLQQYLMIHTAKCFTQITEHCRVCFTTIKLALKIIQKWRNCIILVFLNFRPNSIQSFLPS